MQLMEDKTTLVKATLLSFAMPPNSSSKISVFLVCDMIFWNSVDGQLKMNIKLRDTWVCVTLAKGRNTVVFKWLSYLWNKLLLNQASGPHPGVQAQALGGRQSSHTY